MCKALQLDSDDSLISEQDTNKLSYSIIIIFHQFFEFQNLEQLTRSVPKVFDLVKKDNTVARGEKCLSMTQLNSDTVKFAFLPKST